MSGDMLTTWGVVLELPGIDDEWPALAARWFAQGRGAYFERCPQLAAFLRAEEADLRVTAERVGPLADASCPGGMRAGVSVVEVRRSSFDMAVRFRATGDGAGRPVNGRCTIVVERCATGERIPVPREVRDEFIAIQLAARELC